MKNTNSIKFELGRRIVRNFRGPGILSARHFIAIIFDWLLIAATLVAVIPSENFLILGGAALILAGRQHALMVMMHEAAHRQISRHAKINDWLSDLLCAWPVFLDTHLYRIHHLKHHQYLNTEKDPDWVRKHGHREWTYPKKKRDLLNDVARTLLGKGAFDWAIVSFMFLDFRNMKKIIPKAGFWSAVILGAFMAPAFGKALALYFFSLFFIFPLFQMMRSTAEHFALTYESEFSSSRDIVGLPMEAFFFYPHNVGLHLTHHLFPQIPFYDLPRVHREFLELTAGTDIDPHINQSYFFGKSVFKDLLTKEIKNPQSKSAQSSGNKAA